MLIRRCGCKSFQPVKIRSVSGDFVQIENIETQKQKLLHESLKYWNVLRFNWQLYGTASHFRDAQWNNDPIVHWSARNSRRLSCNSSKICKECCDVEIHLLDWRQIKNATASSSFNWMRQSATPPTLNHLQLQRWLTRWCWDSLRNFNEEMSSQKFLSKPHDAIDIPFDDNFLCHHRFIKIFATLIHST